MNNPPKNESFIKDGTLSVEIKPSEVTWYDFLWFSRSTNANCGGWNNWRFWWDRGVEKLLGDSSASFLKKWTQNSVREGNPFRPRCRTGDFKFTRPLSLERDALAKALDTKSIEAANENELSYALHTRHPKLEVLQDFRPFGYEIPLAEDSEGQLKIDLFGTSEMGDPSIKIVELKQANNTSDSPLFAFVESICYGLQTLLCRKAILEEVQELNEMNYFKNVDLVIAAPTPYWNYWRRENGREEIEGAFQKILLPVNEVVEQHFGSTLTIKLIELRACES